MDKDEEIFRAMTVTLAVDLLNMVIDRSDGPTETTLGIVKGVMVKMAEELNINLPEKSENIRKAVEAQMDAEGLTLDIRDMFGFGGPKSN